MRFYTLIILLLIAVPILAADFKVSSFESDPKDGTAVHQDFKVVDVNGNICALLKVLTDLEELSFESSLLEKVVDTGFRLVCIP